MARIVLARPAVEAGEKLGFLPGDLQEKVDPYLRPLYDALYDLLDYEKVARLLERNAIEVAPIAFMRGRTLNDAFVIIDEAQNTTTEQMKMVLTRIGFGSKVVVTGDITQIDLPQGKTSGLVEAISVLVGRRRASPSCYFDEKDVVRHKLVQAVIKAYERLRRRPGPAEVGALSASRRAAVAARRRRSSTASGAARVRPRRGCGACCAGRRATLRVAGEVALVLAGDGTAARAERAATAARTSPPTCCRSRARAARRGSATS